MNLNRFFQKNHNLKPQVSFKSIFFVGVILSFQIFLLTNLQFIAWPEMLYEPYLMNHGFTIYKDITIAHAPLLLFLLQIIFKIVGNPVIGLKIFTLIISLLSGILVAFLSYKLWQNKKISLLAWLIYIFIQPYFEGNGIWFDHLVAVFALISFYFFYKFLFKNLASSKDILWAGFFLGLAGVSKQTAGWLVIPAFFGFVILLIKSKNIFSTFITGIKFSLFCLLPWLCIGLWLLSKGALADFWHWAFEFGITILPRAGGQIQLPAASQLFSAFFPFSLLLVWLFLDKNQPKFSKFFFVLWTIFSFWGLYPRFERFHFQPALPLLSIAWAKTLLDSKVRIYPILITIIFLLLQSRFFLINWQLPDRFLESDVLKTVDWVKNNTLANQSIYTFNTWDHFYALADRQAAVRPVSLTLEWYLKMPGLEDKLVASLDSKDNPVIIMEAYKESGLGAYRPNKLDSFIKQNFVNTALIDNRFIILEKK